MIKGDILQAIFNEVYNYLPDGWEKVVIYLEYGVDSYSMAFYAKVMGKYTKCYDLGTATDEQIAAAFRKIDQLILPAQKKDKWTNMTMIVEANGKMHTDFDYTDLSESAYKYSKAWKAKYLN